MTGFGLYILDERGEPVACDDIVEWGRWFEEVGNRRVASDDIDGVHVSTVFLGTNHAFWGGPPILWETMIFGGALSGEQWRYASRDEAVRGHADAVALVRGSHT